LVILVLKFRASFPKEPQFPLELCEALGVSTFGLVRGLEKVSPSLQVFGHFSPFLIRVLQGLPFGVKNLFLGPIKGFQGYGV